MLQLVRVVALRRKLVGVLRGHEVAGAADFPIRHVLDGRRGPLCDLLRVGGANLLDLFPTVGVGRGAPVSALQRQALQAVLGSRPQSTKTTTMNRSS